MEFNLLDGDMGHVLWIAQTLTISAVFAMLWLHKRRRHFHLYFGLGFFVSALGSSLGLQHNGMTPLAAFITISAHTFWICGTFHAQGRKFPPWCLTPPLVLAAAMCIPFVRGSEIASFYAFHTASITGFCLQSIALLTTTGYRSGTRRFLAVFMALYGLSLAIFSSVSYYFISLQSPFATIATVVNAIAALFGLTIILMSAAKMVIEDIERKLTDLAISDHLTGIYNRRALDKVFRDGQLQASDSLRFISITMFDIDHFKKINDQYGHAFGDHVLKSFVELVKKHLRPSDNFIRMGGEEFAVISEISALFEASQLAERIRIDFGNLVLKQDGKCHRATVSAGIAAQPIYRADLYVLLSMADRGLYAAKKSGRDRCVIHDEATSVVIPSQERDPADQMETYTDKQVAVLNRISAIAEVHKAAP